MQSEFMTLETMTADDFAELIDVSRETLQRLERYIDLLKHWQRAINLVGAIRSKTHGDAISWIARS